MTSNNFDFGFGGEEFQGELNSVPYAQFLNGGVKTYGLAITSTNAELANFTPDGHRWQETDHEFNDGSYEKQIFITTAPRLVILNRSQPLMSDGTNTIPFDREVYGREKGEYKAFSYVVVLPVDDDNQPLSELPFRLKCSGFAGITFLKNYSYYNNPDSFTKKFLQVYKTLTGDRSIDKNDIFFAHAIYLPELVREKATSTYNGQTSFAVQTKSFIEPTADNFASLIIKNGSPTSNKIKSLIEETKEWLKTAPVEIETEANDSYTEPTNSYEETDPVAAGIHPPSNSSLRSPEQTQVVDRLGQPTPEQTELAVQIWNDCKVIGWNKEGLNKLLIGKYKVAVDKLNTLSEAKLIEIYNTIQEPVVRDMYCPEVQEQTEIPF